MNENNLEKHDNMVIDMDIKKMIMIREYANKMRDVLLKNSIDIVNKKTGEKKKYIQVQGYLYLAGLEGLEIQITDLKFTEEYAIAKCEVYKNGKLISSEYGYCGRDEDIGKSASRYAFAMIHLAETRAKSRALRTRYAPILSVLDEFAFTGAEEIITLSGNAITEEKEERPIKSNIKTIVVENQVDDYLNNTQSLINKLKANVLHDEEIKYIIDNLNSLDSYKNSTENQKNYIKQLLEKRIKAKIENDKEQKQNGGKLL